MRLRHQIRADAPTTRLRKRCRFISGNPLDIATLGERIYCNEPTVHFGSSWCAKHLAIVFVRMGAKPTANPPISPITDAS